jgi:hypothetical protein
MSEEFNEFVERQIKNHARRTGMKAGDAHPWVRHSSRAAAFEAWGHQQKTIDQQQAQIDQLLAIVHGVEDSFATYSVEFKHSDPRGSMKRLIKTVEKMALDPAISHRANKLRADAVRESVSRIFDGVCEDTRKLVIIEGRYRYVSTRELDELADKIERGEA